MAEFDLSRLVPNGLGSNARMQDEDDMDSAVRENRAPRVKLATLKDLILSALAHRKTDVNGRPVDMTDEQRVSIGFLARKVRATELICDFDEKELTLIKSKMDEAHGHLVAFEANQMLKI